MRKREREKRKKQKEKKREMPPRCHWQKISARNARNYRYIGRNAQNLTKLARGPVVAHYHYKSTISAK